MTTESQRNGMELLAELWHLSPEIRLGQLLSHLGFLGEVHLSKGLGEIEDDELIAIMYRHREELVARQQGLPPPPIAASPNTSISGSPLTTDA